MSVLIPVEVTASVSEREFLIEDLGGQILLAIDTALGSSVALGVGEQVFEVSHDDPRGHAEAIGLLLARVLEISKIPASCVTGVVSGIGPGPFTGLRVGIAAAQAFAVGRGVPLYPVQGHEAVALAAMLEGAEAVRVVQDAKRRELFVTEYDRLTGDGIPKRIAGPALYTRETYVSVETELWPERIPAGRLVQLAARRLHAGREFEADRAVYLRAPDVQPPKPGLLAVVQNSAGVGG